MLLKSIDWNDLAAEMRERLPKEVGAWLSKFSGGKPKSKKSTPKVLYLISANFGEEIVRDGVLVTDGLQFDADDAAACELYAQSQARRNFPIGFAMTKSLEIAAPSVFAADRQIAVSRLPLTVLYPGNAFGLWENFTSDRSHMYTVRAGCPSFLIPLPLGNRDQWKRSGNDLSLATCRNLRWEKASQLRFSKATGNRIPDHWSADILLIDWNRARTAIPPSNEAYVWFLKATIEQLASGMLVRRTLDPTGGRDQAAERSIRALIEGLARGQAYGYYLTWADAEMEVDEDLPIQWYAKLFAGYLSELPKNQRPLGFRGSEGPVARATIPFFVPCRLIDQTRGRARNKVYRLPDVCRSLGATRDVGRHIGHLVDVQFPNGSGQAHRILPPLTRIPPSRSYVINRYLKERVAKDDRDRLMRLPYGATEGRLLAQCTPAGGPIAVRWFSCRARQKEEHLLRAKHLRCTYGDDDALALSKFEGMPVSISWIFQLDADPNTLEHARS